MKKKHARPGEVMLGRRIERHSPPAMSSRPAMQPQWVADASVLGQFIEPATMTDVQPAYRQIYSPEADRFFRDMGPGYARPGEYFTPREADIYREHLRQERMRKARPTRSEIG